MVDPAPESKASAIDGQLETKLRRATNVLRSVRENSLSGILMRSDSSSSAV